MSTKPCRFGSSLTQHTFQSSVDQLGLSSPNLLSNIIVSPSGFLPHVSLFLLIASPRDLPGALEQDIRSTSVTASEVLDRSMPVLGSAFQGMAVDSAAIWVWELVRLIEKDEGNVDEMTAQMLVEVGVLLPPNRCHDRIKADWVPY
jgi:hypothetical protein